MTPEMFVLDYDTPTDHRLQKRIDSIDARLRAKYGMSTEQTAVGVLDLNRMRLAMVHPDRIEYAASVAKIGILLAYFQIHPEAGTQMDSETEHELGLMIKASSNEMAAKYSRAMGLREIQQVLNAQGFYDASHGGGIWVGKALRSEQRAHRRSRCESLPCRDGSPTPAVLSPSVARPPGFSGRVAENAGHLPLAKHPA
jgi:hypothetical protein